MPIRILDAATVGRIAAGEVVERPSSVVKELMENSLDAGATSITVEIRGGGIDYLRVTDNGCGIEPGQVRLAFENHATSKLQHADQLDDIRTLGFRGEALPSIAAVSHVEMTTRARGQQTGVKLNIDGGQDLRVRETGCPEGTTLVMKDLFFNIPVRRAFLKKPSYEGGLVSDAVARMMIGNPKVSVRFINNGSTVYHSFGDGKLRHAVFAVYGKAAAEQMIELDASEGGTRVYGLIGVGELAKATRAHQMFFINGRSMRCPLLTRVLERVCKSRVTIGMYPMCALNLVLPPNAVDVNVHPNKLEVRFRDETMTQVVVEKLLNTAFDGERVLDPQRDVRKTPEVERVATVREIMPEEMRRSAEKPQMPPLPTRGETDRTETFMDRVERERERFAQPDGNRLQEAVMPLRQTVESPAPTPGAAPAARKVVQMPEANSVSQAAPAGSVLEMPTAEKSTVQRVENAPAVPTQPERAVTETATVEFRAAEKAEQIAMSAEPAGKRAPDYRIIGVLFRTYILLEVEDTLLLIDQHAAHERLKYEQYMAQMEAGTASQQLLTPLILRLSAQELALIQENQDVLSDAGYTVEAFGDHDIQVRAVPHILGRAEIRPLFLDMLSSLNRLKAATVDARRAEVMQMACKSAVKGGDALSDSEIQALVSEMLETGAPPTCPHGRPVVKAISRRDLEKMFKRIQ